MSESFPATTMIEQVTAGWVLDLRDLPRGASVGFVTGGQMAVVRFRDPAGGDHDAHSRAVLARVQAEGTCFPSGTVWRGVAGLRLSVSSWRTTEDDVRRTIAALLDAHGG